MVFGSDSELRLHIPLVMLINHNEINPVNWGGKQTILCLWSASFSMLARNMKHVT